MELRQYFNLLRKWIWLVVACTVIAGVTAFIVSRQQTPIYQATSTVLINEARATQAANYQDILSSERIARTYAQMLQDWPVLEETFKSLGFSAENYRELKRALQVDISVTPVRDTQLVQLNVEASDPQVAAGIANAMPIVFSQTNQARQRERFDDTRQDLQAELDKVEQDISATQAAITELGEANSEPAQAELTQLQSQLRRHEASYNTLVNSLEQLRLAEVQTSDNIVMVAPAQLPQDPIRPRVLFNALLAAIVGAMLAVGAAFLIEYLDDTIKTPDDIRELTGLPTLGAVVAMEETTQQKRLVPLHSPRSPAAEAYRVLRTNLQFSSLDKPLQTLLVTSPGPGEGKSTTAANLATVMAQAGNRVILVDADLRRPNIHRLFQVPNNTGVTTALLQGNADCRSVLQETSAPNLRIITTGPVPPNPAEMLGSARMGEFIKQVQSDCDVLIIDSPPVLAVADAAILSTQVDGALLVVSAGETSADMLVSALERLESVGSRPLGVVLNKLTERKSGYHYYYYYQYASRYEADGGDEGPRPGQSRLRRTRKPAGQAPQQPALGESRSQ